MQRVLIAGSGYVGSKLATLYGPSDEVFALRRGEAESMAGVKGIRFDLVHGDVEELPRGLDKIIFCAGPGGSTLAAYQEIYGQAFIRLKSFLARTGAKGARFILTSSTSVYGQHDGEEVDEESEAKPESATSMCIVAAEGMLSDGDVAVRLGGIYGPGRTSFIRAVREGTMVVNKGRSAFTNRVHRDDAAGILKFCAELPLVERVYNGVDCEPASRAEVASWLAAELGVALRAGDGEEVSSFLRGNKRVSNRRLVAAGYRFLFPTFREGYKALLGEG